MLRALSLGVALSSLVATAGEFRSVAKPVRGQYVVAFTSEVVTRGEIEEKARALADKFGARILHIYYEALPGFAISGIDDRTAMEISNEPIVAYVEQDGIVKLSSADIFPPWGLDRIDQRSTTQDNLFRYTTSGAGTNIYIIDSGIRATHIEFRDSTTMHSRVVLEKDFVGTNGDDCNGHGTFVAGVAAGRSVGVAKDATIRNVRVVGCGGEFEANLLISAIDHVTTNLVLPAVVNMSLETPSNTSVDTATSNLISAGAVVVVAAGNGNVDASNISPARVAGAITVGATNSSDGRWVDFNAGEASNTGASLDLFAPGAGIVSSHNLDDLSEANKAGTSVAAPFVAGVASAYLQSHPLATPAQVQAKIVSAATTGTITNAGTNSPNRILFSQLGPILSQEHQIDTGGVETINAVLDGGNGSVVVAGDHITKSGCITGIGGQSYYKRTEHFIKKFDQSKNVVWSVTWEDGDGCSKLTPANNLTSMTTDSSGNIHILGNTKGSVAGPNFGGYDFYLMTFSPTGSMLRYKQYGSTGDDFAYDLRWDHVDGFLYVAGTSDGPYGGTQQGGKDAFVASFDRSTLAQLNAIRFGGPGDDRALSITRASSSTLFVGGDTTGTLPNNTSSGGKDAFLTVLRYDLIHLLTHQFGTSGDETITGITARMSRNLVYVVGNTTGSFGGINAGGSDIFVAQYDSSSYINGTVLELWKRQIGSAANEHAARGIVTPGFDLFIAGWAAPAYLGGSAGDDACFLVKISESGEQTWEHRFGTVPIGAVRAIGLAGIDSVLVGGGSYDYAPLYYSGVDAFYQRYLAY